MNVSQRRAVINLTDALTRVVATGADPRVILVADGEYAGRAAIVVEDPDPGTGEPCHRTVAIVAVDRGPGS